MCFLVNALHAYKIYLLINAAIVAPSILNAILNKYCSYTTFFNWQPLCAGQYGKYGILIGSEALTTGFIQTGIDIHSVTTMMVASYVNKSEIDANRSKVVTSVIALFTLFCLVRNFALRHNQVWQCNSIATLYKYT